MIEKNALPYGFRVKITHTLGDKRVISRGTSSNGSIFAHCVMILLH